MVGIRDGFLTLFLQPYKSDTLPPIDTLYRVGVYGMSLKNFLKLVEIQTKIASMFPFLFGTLFALYRYGHINLINLGLMFLSLLAFDMATTTINNYVDYTQAKNREYRDNHNIIGVANISLGSVRAIIGVLLLIATTAGIFLVSQVGTMLLFLGAFSFFVGVFYTFGPIPISRMPLGEIVSGFMMGFVIVYLSVYIHYPELLVLDIVERDLFLRVQLVESLIIFLVATPFICLISNLMLANNICDLEQDITNNRFLLPYYIGRTKSLLLFQVVYYTLFVLVIVAVAVRVLPWISLATLLVFPLVQKNISLFMSRQVKEETFSVAVKNLIIVSSVYTLSLVALLMVRFLW